MTTLTHTRSVNRTNPRDNPEVLTVVQVAAELAVSPQAVRDWITRGVMLRARSGHRQATGETLKLAAIRTPHAYRVRRAELDRFLARIAQANGAPQQDASEAAVDRLIEPPTYPPSRRVRRKAGAA